jgi:uncharacterized membrane protein
MVISLVEKTLIKKITTTFYDNEYPSDLILIMVWLAASIAAIYLPVLNAKPITYVLTIPLMLVIPGYCLVSALFPKKSDIGLLERFVLSFGLSITILSLIGLGLIFTPMGIQHNPIIIALTVFSLEMILITHFRRAFLAPKERFRMPFSEIFNTFHKGISPEGSTKVDQVLRVVLILVIIVVILTTFSILANPKEGAHFSEFYILGEKRMAADYPDQLNIGLTYPIYIGVGNHEYRNTRYTIETWMMYTEFDNVTNTSLIIAMDPNDKLSLTLAHNETRIIPYNLSVKKTGYNRVEFLLFNESVPSPLVTGMDRINASYRNLHLWIADR